ncbi:MAG: hypothetical protein MI924_13720 [Chloroflexales bacterium]|nr:hypothetical protein [Chloroflexales bacterium]
MIDPDTDDLLARLQALSPDERTRLLQQLDLVPTPNAVVDMGGSNQFGAASFGDVAGHDVRKGIEGEVTLSADARINGVAVGVNLGTIIYGRDPSEDERRRLAWYLARLASKLSRLPLRGLEERLDRGDGVALARVYVRLATTDDTVMARGKAQELAEYIKPKVKRTDLSGAAQIACNINGCCWPHLTDPKRLPRVILALTPGPLPRAGEG